MIKSEEYYKNILNSPTEEAKKLTILSYLDKTYNSDNEISRILQKLREGAEKPIYDFKRKKFPDKSDSQFENVIIEFKKNLIRSETEAKIELQKYLKSIWLDKTSFNFVLLATDGVIWKFYGLNSKEFTDFSKIDWNNENLLIEKFRFQIVEDNFSELISFLNTHLFSSIEKLPTIENFLNDFGAKSSTYLNSFYNLKNLYLKEKSSNKVKICFDQWKKYLSVAYNSNIENVDVFIRHTYLSIFAKLLSYVLFSKDEYIDIDELKSILEGEKFFELNIGNFTEKDFFCWCLSKSYIKKIFLTCIDIRDVINSYDYSNVRNDILKKVYEDLMDPLEKKELGEYYTPDWLCDRIIDNLNIKKDSKIIDPACGSGSFLRSTINKFILKYPELNAQDISNNIYGLDIHPLSVLISKATVLIALKEKIHELNDFFYLNIFMTNTLLPPLERELEGEVFPLSIGEETFKLNSSIFEDIEVFQIALDHSEKLASLHVEEKQFDRNKFSQSLTRKLRDFEINENTIKSFYFIYCGLKKAKENDKDSIWKFIISNLIRSFFFHNKFDFVVGNPPWFTYKSIKNIRYQEDLKKIGEIYNFLPEERKNLTHFEIAALFLIHSFYNLLSKKSSIAFVLPRTFFQGDHHKKTRSQEINNFTIKEIWDLDNVKNLFKIPSCVLFIDNFSKKNKDDIWNAKIFSGNSQLIKKDGNLFNYLNLKEEDKKMYLSKLANDTAISYKKVNLNKPNYYKREFSQGASISPRSFYFYDYTNNISRNKNINIKSSDDFIAKEPWNKILKGIVSNKFTFVTAINNSLIPFAIIKLYDLVLPVISRNNRFEILNSNSLIELGELDTAKWFKKAENYWGTNQTRMSMQERLNYSSYLTKQKLDNRYVVLYTGSATNASSAVVDRKNLDKNFIADTTTYCFFTNNENEAYYISGFLNSNYANKIIKEFQPKGLFGARHVHTRILKVPFPEFNSNNKLHKELSSLSKEISLSVSEKIPLNSKGILKPNDLGRLRVEIYKYIAKPNIQIDNILKNIGHK